MARTLARAAAAFAGVVLAVATADAASADTATTAGRTVHGSFSESGDFVDNQVCQAEGFAVTVHQVSVVDYTVLFDANGNFVRALLHVPYQATLSANGITLYEADRFTNMFYADGTSQTVGLKDHITGPGGLVELDAGRIVFNPDGTVASASGLHPELSGEIWCSALGG